MPSTQRAAGDHLSVAAPAGPTTNRDEAGGPTGAELAHQRALALARR